MSAPKMQIHPTKMEEDSDTRNSTYVPKMELLMTHYIHEGKKAIMYRLTKANDNERLNCKRNTKGF